MTQPTLVDLDGDVIDLDALASVAPACDCAIGPGPGQKFGWLSGFPINRRAGYPAY
jgi:hypothetical protein